MSLRQISPKAYKAIAFDGSEDILPASMVFGRDYEVQKSEAYWISCWILEKKNIQYSTKKAGWYNPETREVEPVFNYVVTHHVPERKEPVASNEVEGLRV